MLRSLLTFLPRFVSESYSRNNFKISAANRIPVHVGNEDQARALRQSSNYLEQKVQARLAESGIVALLFD